MALGQRVCPQKFGYDVIAEIEGTSSRSILRRRGGSGCWIVLFQALRLLGSFIFDAG